MNPARIAILALAGLGASALAAPVPKEAKKTPLEQLQGKWLIVSVDRGEGQKSPPVELEAFTLSFEGGKLSTSTGTEALRQRLVVTCDFATTPMQMDVQFGSRKVAGIFRLEDGKLFWSHGLPDAARPKEFKGGNGDKSFIFKAVDK